MTLLRLSTYAAIAVSLLAAGMPVGVCAETSVNSSSRTEARQNDYGPVGTHGPCVRAQWDLIVDSSHPNPDARAVRPYRSELGELGDSLTIDEVTVTGRRAPARVSAAVPTQVMGARQIEELGIPDLADAVRRFAGVNVRDYGGLGGLKTVSVRSMGATHTAVSYDGVPLSNCLGGQIDIGRFSLFDISMLTLSAGGDTDLLQPARLAVAAAVLGLSGAEPQFDEGRHHRFDGEVHGGSFGYIAPAARWSLRLTPSVSASIAASGQHTDGNYPYILQNGRERSRQRRINSDMTSAQAEANIFAHPSEATSIHSKTYFYRSERGLPGAVRLYNPYSAERLWDTDLFSQMRLRHRWSPTVEMQGILRYGIGANTDIDRGAHYADGVRKDRFRQEEYFASASAVWRALPAVSLALAQDGTLNTLWTNLASCPFPRRYTSASALTARYAAHGVKADLALANIYIKETVAHGATPAPQSRLVPSGAVSWRPLARHQFYLRAMCKSTFRMPTFNDLYYDRVGTRTLRPERAVESNLGLTFSLPQRGPLTYLTLTADGYLNAVKDKIVAVPTTFVWKMYNFGRVRILGLDLTASASLRLPLRSALDLTGTLTAQRAVDLTDPSARTYGHQLPYTPKLFGNLSATLRTPWLTVGYTLGGVGERYFLAENIPSNRLAPYAEQNITLSRELRLRGVGLTLSAEVMNLADVQYDVIKFYPMPGRSLRAGVKFKF